MDSCSDGGLKRNLKLDANGYYTPDFFSANGLQSYLDRSVVIDFALSFSDRRGCVIQAGGHVGVWPRKLAGHFSEVVCFEPVPSNWECLIKNANQPNVRLYQEALGAKNGTIKINYRLDSSGGHHVATRLDRLHIEVPMRALDSMDVTDVDAIFLDIEGVEIEALTGAKNILKERKPMLVIENNGCSRKYGYSSSALSSFLEPYGYHYMAGFGEDEIFL